MKNLSNYELAKWIATFCLGFLSMQNQAAQFVEISAEIETFGYRLGDTNSIARAKPKTINVACITGSSEWYLENDFARREQWLFDGTNVVCRTLPASDSEKTQLLKEAGTSAPDFNGRERVWKSPDGHPLGHFGVNVPWLAFCSATYLKREDRIIPLPAALLRHCPDRYAYTASPEGAIYGTNQPNVNCSRAPTPSFNISLAN